MEEIKFEAKEECELLNCATIFNEPLIMYEGDEFTMEYDDFKVISMVVRRKNSS